MKPSDHMKVRLSDVYSVSRINDLPAILCITEPSGRLEEQQKF
jgi:hypothetical protein